MHLLWFYLAIFLAISDELHTKLLWGIFSNFYILFGGLIQHMVSTNIQTWLIHETFEGIFHFIMISLVTFSWQIGLIAAVVHWTIDIYHELGGKGKQYGWLYHRCFHFTIESLIFIMIFGF